MRQRPDIDRIKKLPLLTVILGFQSLRERFDTLSDFLWCKGFEMSLPLTEAERKFKDTCKMFGVIPADGWRSVFDQSYDYPRLGDIIEVLRFCGQDSTADAIEEARELCSNGRTDLMTLEERFQAGVRGFRSPSERRRFYALGDIVEKLPYADSYWDLLRWPDAHRSAFVDFARPS